MQGAHSALKACSQTPEERGKTFDTACAEQMWHAGTDVGLWQAATRAPLLHHIKQRVWHQVACARRHADDMGGQAR